MKKINKSNPSFNKLGRDKILWLTWKDRRHPAAGGAEAVNEEIAKRLVQNGVSVTFIVAGAPGLPAEEMINGCRVIRLGNRWTVYWLAYRYYKKHFVGFADLVIDEMNTLPFGCRFYVREPNIILCYQLCRQIWFQQLFFPLNLLGYLLEPIYLWWLNDRAVLTESESAKTDLISYGFQPGKIAVFPIGLENQPLTLEEFNKTIKNQAPTVLYFGSIRKMKQPDQAIRAFELAKKQIPDLQLWLAGLPAQAGGGGGRYLNKILKLVSASPFKKDITYFGAVGSARKLELMRQAHLLLVTSKKEGWGIVVTEAASQGTPAVVYNVDGLRDSCHDGVTGLLAESGSPADLAKKIIKLFNNQELYQRYRQNAWQDSQNYNYQKSYEVFTAALDRLV